MRAVVQRVKRASVKVDGSRAAIIGRGLLVLLGVSREDGPSQASWMAGKLARLRIFPDGGGLMNLSVGDIEGEVLLVSQFTLLADASRGNRPGFAAAAGADAAKKLYLSVAEELAAAGVPVKTGLFGAAMEVELVNEGPVTIVVESP